MSDAATDMPESRYQRVYPRSVKGRFRNLKWGILIMAYAIYFLVPWTRWARDAGPDQTIMFDLVTRRFYVFDLVVHPQDIFWLSGLLMIGALLLFMVTGVLGRVWCGYFCFQTLWTDLFMWFERIAQGERPARIRLAKAPWSGEKVLKLGLTHFLWLSFSFATGYTFMIYWGDAYVLTAQFFSGEAPFPAYATTAFLTATTYVMAGIAREQACIYMCPYARFQSVMFDRDTWIVAYDANRGEGQGGRHKMGKGYKTQEERSEKGAGDCIDCGYCVQACPTGIDIRDGIQLECISCAMCIDACDTIMDSMGWERGLISYSSENKLEGIKGKKLKFQTVGYAVAIGIVSYFLVTSVMSRADMELYVQQERAPLYVQLSDGRIQNKYVVKVVNKAQRPVTVVIDMQGLEGAEMDTGRFKDVTVPPNVSRKISVKVKLPADVSDEAQLNFKFVALTPEDDEIGDVKHDAQFSLPFKERR